jgi:putative mycofactocin binding protein MftB
VTTANTTLGVLDRAWDVNPRVSIRPERFGALLYHFGTRRLSFIKDRRLFAVVTTLSACADAREACVAAGLATDELTPYAFALSQLVETDMLKERQ